MFGLHSMGTKGARFQSPLTNLITTGGVGWVRYFINVVVDIRKRFDKEHKHIITVLPKADLNTDPRAKVSCSMML